MGPNVLTALKHDVHARLRKRIAGAFSMTSVRSMEHIIDDRVQEFQAKMGEKQKLEKGSILHYGPSKSTVSGHLGLY